jgi:hypothetical protein
VLEAGEVRRLRDNLEDLGVDKRKILKWIIEKWDGEAWTGLMSLRIEKAAGYCQCRNEPSGFLQFELFID